MAFVVRLVIALLVILPVSVLAADPDPEAPPRTATGPATKDVSRGKELYLRYCSGCHGEDGRGEAKTFRPSVGNLSVKDLMDQVPDEYLFTVIQRGGAAVGKNAAMPAWNRQLLDQDIWDIVAFVRTLSQY